MKIWRIDINLLKATRAVIVFCNEWLSLSQARIEQLLGVAFIVLDEVGWARYHAGGLRTFSLAFVPLNLLWVWARHRTPAAARANGLLHNVRSLVFRLLMVFLAVFCFGSSLLRHNVDLIDLSTVVVVPFIYVTALPHDDGSRRGKRRKLALAKLKEMFGTSWVPLPEGGPA